MPVHGAGYGGFRVARRPGGEDLEVVVCDPASLEVVRRRKKAKTDRTGARRMVRERLRRANAVAGLLRLHGRRRRGRRVTSPRRTAARRPLRRLSRRTPG